MSASSLVAVHQPTFFPWLGYFDKLKQADLLIVLDDVQAPRTGAGTWLNRVKLAVQGQARWATMPIERPHGVLQQVGDVRINDSSPWRAKLRKTIETSYGRAPHFGSLAGDVLDLVENPTTSLVEYNVEAVRCLVELLGIETPRLRASALEVEGTGTDRLIGLVTAAGGTAYLSGDGAAGYQQDERFGRAGLTLVQQHFDHPVYEQFNTPEFVPGLSALDALFNLGAEAARSLLRPPRSLSST